MTCPVTLSSSDASLCDCDSHAPPDHYGDCPARAPERELDDRNDPPALEPSTTTSRDTSRRPPC